ncbi:MAG: carbohydrate ABC transporter permease [Clostridia bacterium]|nr:carbohydrate ABC transporter permease [Clostridia bacterium]
MKKKFNPFQLILLVILVLYSLIMFALIAWGLLTSLKHNSDFLLKKNFFGLPEKVEWQNYADVLNNFDIKVNRGTEELFIGMDLQILYTLLYVGVCAFLSASIPLIVSYAASRFKYKFNAVLNGIVVITMILPIVGSQPSMMSLLHSLNVYDNFLGIYLQKFNFTTIYFLIYTGVLAKVPTSFSEAAQIDGADNFTIMFKVILPLVLNVYGTVFLIFFITYWNDYQTPLLYMPTHPTLAYGVWYLTFNTAASTGLNVVPKKMAGCMMLVVPVLILFLIFKDKLMSNLSAGGVKE